MKLNSNLTERRLGWIFLTIWLLSFIFYITWDGWIQEWRITGYDGPNQHFDLNIFDLSVTVKSDGTYIYNSTNNLHNLIYICYFVFFMGWFGLLFDVDWLKQGTMGTVGVSFIATLSTLNPHDHLYILQITYDIVHLSGIFLGLYLFTRYRPSLKLMTPGILLTYVFYILSRIIYEPWPYWEESANAFYSINQINDVPFYFYGLEYSIVLALLFGMNIIIRLITNRIEKRKYWIYVPIIVYTATCLIMLSLNLINLPTIDMTTWTG
ncbi:MAG: hypothetical protein FXF54_12540 [Kosmotoga sp.]|nr:MAG: hypothetical protein FXF54_12540 [Kosmotoga sp.]